MALASPLKCIALSALVMASVASYANARLP
jgi:hypothetical protein